MDSDTTTILGTCILNLDILVDTCTNDLVCTWLLSPAIVDPLDDVTLIVV